MKGTSKVIMGATLVMVVSLAMVLGLILVLLAELYCSLLLRRRQLRISTTNATATASVASAAEAETAASSTSQPQDQYSPDTTPLPTPLSSFHAQGVLQAPRSLLFPATSFKEDCLQTKKQLSQLHHQVIDIPKQEHNTSPRHVGVVSTRSPSISFVPSPPQPPEEEKMGCGNGTSNEKKTSCGDGVGKEHFVYISNPIYENMETRHSGANTPFETPDTSPSRLEMGGSGSSSSSGEEGEIAQPTPPLTPMKKLPAEACSVSLRDARSLATLGSDSNSNNGLSSSSSGSPCTSPSW